jgi:hypothetical protein
MEEELKVIERRSIFYERELELYKQAPPRSPFDFPGETSIGELTGKDMAQLNKWIKTVRYIQPASISLEPQTGSGPMAGVRFPQRKPWYLHIRWTEYGMKREVVAKYRFCSLYGVFIGLPFCAGNDTINIRGTKEIPLTTERK